uniref:Serine racemase n=1 Tax=Hirondellea gigas TaxID=1518452 RepID=A0A2P2I1X6_9CRUS
MAAKTGLCYKDVLSAMSRIRAYVHETPVLTSRVLDEMAGLQLYFKAENMQKTGAFKARGACNAVFALLEEQKKDPSLAVPGIVTHSSGNHGQAVAYAARCAKVPCSVVVPSDTPPVKCEAIQAYGAELVFCEPNPTARKQTAAAIASKTGYCLVHPFDNYNVMAGQGTVALELLRQVPDLDAILVTISGGGLTSGIAVATNAIRPACTVFAVEPEGKLLGRCLAAKQRLWSSPPQYLDTIADAIRSQQVGELTFPILCSLVSPEVFTVTDQQMLDGMTLSLQTTKVLVEAAAGAAVYASVHQLNKSHPHIKKAGVILCGGNTDYTPLPQKTLS